MVDLAAMVHTGVDLAHISAAVTVAVGMVMPVARVTVTLTLEVEVLDMVLDMVLAMVLDMVFVDMATVEDMVAINMESDFLVSVHLLQNCKRP